MIFWLLHVGNKYSVKRGMGARDPEMVYVIKETSAVKQMLCRGTSGMSSPWRRMKYRLEVI